MSEVHQQSDCAETVYQSDRVIENAYEFIVEFPQIHSDAHKKLILVMKCPKCGHSEHMEKTND
jgi:ABC-type ATPase with predicted acetyltransferase domain